MEGHVLMEPLLTIVPVPKIMWENTANVCGPVKFPSKSLLFP